MFTYILDVCCAHKQYISYSSDSQGRNTLLLLLYLLSPEFPCKLCCMIFPFSSVQFRCSVVSNSLRPCKAERARTPCPSTTPGVYSDSSPSSQWCHPAISSSFVTFSSCPQSLPVSGTFPISQLFAWGGQTIGVSASASVLPMNNVGILVIS